jgi:hypothetical protein
MLAYARGLDEKHWGGWPDILTEDGAFGCTTATIDGLMVSRDLLDSIVEMEFIRRSTPEHFLIDARVLDIGAGYGRLAHRLVTAFGRARVFCTDAIEVSHDICRKYLGYRGARGAQVVDPGLVEALLCRANIDLAVNIHSWSECTLPEVEAWLDLLRDCKVPRLLVVPHDAQMQTEWGKHAWVPSGPSFGPAIYARGYRATHTWAGPACWPRDMFLYEMA